MQVVYLEPLHIHMPRAMQQSLCDAHARLGGTSCGAKEVMFLPATPIFRGASYSAVDLDREGATAMEPAHLARCVDTQLRQARVAGEGPCYVVCRDMEALRRVGLNPEGKAAFERGAHVWRLEGLAWQQRCQQRQRREMGVVWERRGGAGRRGRRRREPGVVFELGPWGKERRALSHEEAVWFMDTLVR